MRISTMIFVLIAIGGFCNSADAQLTQSSSSNGLFGSRNLGGTIGGANSSFSGTPGTRLENQENVGQITGNERFTRDARQPGQFVGADSGDASNFFSALGNGGVGGQQGGGRLSEVMNQFNQQNRQNSSRGINMRTRLVLGFPAAPAISTQATARLQVRIAKSPHLRLEAFELTMQGSTAVLRGAADSEHVRQLAARLVLLEPGIESVQNDLKLDTLPAPPHTLLPPQR